MGVYMPDIVGMENLQDVEDLLNGLGISPHPIQVSEGESYSWFSTTYYGLSGSPRVSRQDPDAGVWVNTGEGYYPQCIFVFELGTITPPVVVVPDVVGLSRSDAEAAVTDIGLVVGTVVPDADGTVTNQNPTSGTEVESGSSVDFNVLPQATTPGPTTGATDVRTSLNRLTWVIPND